MRYVESGTADLQTDAIRACAAQLVVDYGRRRSAAAPLLAVNRGRTYAAA